MQEKHCLCCRISARKTPLSDTLLHQRNATQIIDLSRKTGLSG
jgi:hypothetical protein